MERPPNPQPLARLSPNPYPDVRRSRIPWLLLLLVLLTTLPVARAESRDPQRFFFDPTFGDLREELANARSLGKQGVLVMFEQDDCPYCYRMKTTVLNRPEVQDYYKAHFLAFTLDIEGAVEIVDFKGQPLLQKDFALKVHRVRATPVFAFFDLEGQLITRYTGATKDAQEFLLLGEYVVSGAYRAGDFGRYKRARLQGSSQG